MVHYPMAEQDRFRLKYRTSALMSLITLGGHHTLLLTIALVGFAMLAGTALLTNGFASANRLELSVTITGSTVSLVALAAVLWPLLLLALAAFLLVFVIHPMREP
jgi:hypothetical protein